MSPEPSPISTGCSAFNRLPYEILSKIFICCLPQYPLTIIQPSRHVAPILLCHVCSLWRTVALTTTNLWSHLHYQLPVVWDSHGHPFIWDEKAWTNSMECLRWWKKKQGTKPPFLRINVRSQRDKQSSESTERLVRIEGPDEQFLVDYLSSAQYLDARLFYRYLTEQRRAYPNLHTLLHHLPYVPLQIPPNLRRLSLYSFTSSNEQELNRIDHRGRWSSLTHLSLNIACTLPSWFSLIRAVPGLEWAHLCITLLNYDASTYVRPALSTLPALSKLYLHLERSWGRSLDLLGPLFDNLEFPALQSLHLSSSEGSRWDIIQTEVITTRFPQLTHLQLNIMCPDNGYDVVYLGDQFVHEMFNPRSWLCSKNPTNAVRVITIAVEGQAHTKKSDSNKIVQFFKDFLAENISKKANTAPGVSFEIISVDGTEHMLVIDELLESWGGT